MVHDKQRDSHRLLIDNNRGHGFISGVLISWGLLFAVLYITSRMNYPLFHTLADTFTVFIASGIFVVMWYSRHNIDNHYFLFAAISFLFFAFLDFIHMLGNKNMGVFPQYGNLGPALYIASRYLLSISLVLAPLFIKRKLKVAPVFAVYSLVTVFILLFIFYWKNFPVCYIEGVGLTAFKIVSDYVICLILIGALALLRMNRHSFDPRVLRLFNISITLSIATGLSFTLYTDPFGIMNAVGHFFQILSFYLIHLAFIETGLTKPQDILFKKLNESEERLRLANKATNDVVWDWDVVNDTQRWNEAGTVVFGWTEIVERPVSAAWWVERVHPDDRQRVEAGFFAVVDDPVRSHWQDEYRFLKADGTYAEVMDRGYVLRNDQGKAIRMIGAMVSITERKHADEVLKKSERTYRTLAWNLPGIVYRMFLKKDGNIQFYNDTVKNLTGYAIEEFTFGEVCSIDPMIHPDDRESIIKAVKDAILDKQPFDITYRFFHKDGSIRHFHERGTPVMDENSTPLFIDGVIFDITARRQAEEKTLEMEERLQRSEKMEALGLLAGGVAHDLNNALGILVGYSELLYDGLNEEDPLREDVRNIINGGEQAAAIVQDLLTLARRGVQTKAVLGLNKIVSEYLKSPEYLKLTSFHPDIEIKTELDKDLLQISGSKVHLSKTLMNLVSNAAEAMPAGGEIVIRTENRYLDRPVTGYDELLEGDYVVLTVSDEGEGITSEDMKRIFEPFYTKKVMGRSGTGLGLSVVWGTVKDHDGYIDLNSRKGEGTTFYLYFPVTQEKEGEKEPTIMIDEYMGKDEKILVVDDIQNQRDLVRRIFAKLNYRVEVASSGEEAVEYLNANEVDLVVLDMIMEPGIDGFETYRRISEFRPKQKAIIVSGFAETDRVKMAQSLGAGAFVRKPYIRERIGLAVRRELDRK